MFRVLAVPQDAARRRRMALASLVFEAAMVGVIVLYRLILPPALLPLTRSTPLPAVNPMSKPPGPIARSTPRQGSSGSSHLLVVRPPFLVARIVPGYDGVDRVDPPGFINLLGNANPSSPSPGLDGFAVAPTPRLQPNPRQSVLMEGNLIRRIEPEYPRLAKLMRLEGTVVLKAVISPSGRVEKLEVRAGHPLLAQAAIEAVSLWRYRPYILNREPIAVETEITVRFMLSR